MYEQKDNLWFEMDEFEIEKYVDEHQDQHEIDVEAVSMEYLEQNENI